MRVKQSRSVQFGACVHTRLLKTPVHDDTCYLCQPSLTVLLVFPNPADFHTKLPATKSGGGRDVSSLENRGEGVRGGNEKRLGSVVWGEEN